MSKSVILPSLRFLQDFSSAESSSNNNSTKPRKSRKRPLSVSSKSSTNSLEKLIDTQKKNENTINQLLRKQAETVKILEDKARSEASFRKLLKKQKEAVKKLEDKVRNNAKKLQKFNK